MKKESLKDVMFAIDKVAEESGVGKEQFYSVILVVGVCSPVGGGGSYRVHLMPGSWFGFFA